MADPIVTTGVPSTPGANGAVPVRHEIRDLQTNYPRRWSLYIQALNAFQNVDERTWESYYQIAGIHGLPYHPYNGVAGYPGVDKDTNLAQGKGYCTHSSVLFPTWHRPYLALYEQILCGIAQTIAADYPSSVRQDWVTAANRLRIPYWDWAAVPQKDADYFPDIFISDTLSIVTKDSQQSDSGGDLKPVPNPLAFYRFKPLISGDFPNADKEAHLQTTVRWPNSSNQTDNLAARDNLRQETDNNREYWFTLLTAYARYMPFSNTAYPGSRDPGQFGSLEDIHNGLHVSIGGNRNPGHMSQVPYSAFDPLFWLHHTNIDRGFAIWEALNPDSYVEPQNSPNGNFSIKAGTQEGVETDLKPFYISDSSFWKSSDVHETTTFGYAYPETQSWLYEADQYQTQVRLNLRRLYGGSSLATNIQQLRAKVPTTPNMKQPFQALSLASVSRRAQQPLDVSGSSDNLQKLEGLAPHGKYLDWTTNISVQKHALNGTFSVYVFLGDFNREDASTWSTAVNRVGTVAVLGDKETTSCTKCQKDREVNLQVTGQVPLTLALAERCIAGQMQDLTVDSVVPFLQKNLHWRVLSANNDVGADDGSVARSQVAGLTVSVISNEVTVPATADGLPQYAREVTVHPEATTNATGGHRGDGTGVTDAGQV